MDPRIERLADVLVNYSLEAQPEQLVAVQGSPLASPLVLAVHERLLRAGSFPMPVVSLPGVDELALKYGNDDQLRYITPVQRAVIEQAGASLSIISEPNTRRLSGVDPARQRLAGEARRELLQRMMERSASGELDWCITLFPTEAHAQDADMSISDFSDFVFRACHVDDPDEDPVAYWREMSAEHERLIEWLSDKRQVEITGPDTDLRLSVEGRTWMNADGRKNFPDGEIFTAPIEDSIDGTIRYSFPAITGGREVEDVRLWFEKGKVVRATAGRNEDFLLQMLESDEGARYVGEFAFGTNFGIDRFTKNILFDEKIGGTIHIALGAGYPETGSKNQSAVHWDMICDLREGGRVTVDGEPFLVNGKYVI
ncbi:MAG: aminopeptidase [Thermomicrobiales bacterium]